MSKRVRFADQIRHAIDESGLSRYAICKQIKLDQGAMSRFMKGKSGLLMETLDRLADLLDLNVTVGRKDKRSKGR